MEPNRARRIAIPLIIGFIALLVVVVPRMIAPQRAAPAPPPVEAPPQPPEAEPAPVIPGEVEEVDPEVEPEPEEPAVIEPPAPDEVISLEGLRPAPVEIDPAAPPQTLGSLDRRYGRMFVEFTPHGGGIERITLSNYWQTAWAKRQADAHYDALTADPTAEPPPLPDEQWRYVLMEQVAALGNYFPVLAASSITIGEPGVDPITVQLHLDETGPVYWHQVRTGEFEMLIINDDDVPVLRITRRFTLGPRYEINLDQRVENLSGRDLTIRWNQYGPSDLEEERARYFDSRRFRFGYQRSLDPTAPVLSQDRRLITPRMDAIKRYSQAGAPPLWPTSRTQERSYHLSWFGVTTRYFTLTVHPPVDEHGRGPRTLTDTFEQVLCRSTSADRATAATLTWLISPERALPAGETAVFDVGIYAGPMDRAILDEEPYASLGMDQLIIYMMSVWCAICTFQWLAHFLMWFMGGIHWLLADWGLAIIALVCFVRLLLHPITKKSQINMMRFGKKMQKMAPEMQKLQKKYDDGTKEGKQKIQQESMRLMREHGVNPLQAVGCLPMFLQFPIWIALYAMLYFAFDLRQEPAFFGIFQWITGGAWPFLADLASGDHFFGEFREPVPLFGFYVVTGWNILPLVLGVVFYIQQKYMTPPPSPTMSAEQIQQQKIMRIMLVVMMPLALYPAPAGLTLYIITSSVIGIIESRYVRAHVDQMDLEGPGPEKGGPGGPGGPKKPKPKKPRDAQGRAYAEALERSQEKAKAKKKGPPPSWKKRK